MDLPAHTRAAGAVDAHNAAKISAGRSLNVPDERLDWRTKGLLTDDARPAGRDDLSGVSIFEGPFSWPLLTLCESAVRHNVAALATFCSSRGVRLAPHAKTTMAPALLKMQLESGAWGFTVATAHQLQVLRRLGATRVLLANELVDERALRWLAAELAGERRFDCYCYVDSVPGVAAMAAAAGPRPFRVLIEIGRPGGRTGCRSSQQAEALARTATACGLQVFGVAGYEGGLQTETAVRAYLAELRTALCRLHSAGLLATAAPMVSAGGSAWFDIVAAELTGGWPADLRVETVLRSGAYIGHDDDFYARATPYASRIAGGLRPALRLWAQVLSTPEPGLAIAGFGKRDASYDLGLPLPLLVRAIDGTPRQAAGMAVTKLDDQHAYVSVGAAPLAVGELVAFGLSHPCTVFDKWRTILLVDDGDLVLDVVHTYF